MPLIILSGLPSSGKSTRANQLEEYFAKRGKQVKVITENLATPKAGFQKNELYADSQKEKTVRSDLKSEVNRIQNTSDVLILDGGNYIKGYRYEIFCASKAVRITQCTIYCAIRQEVAWELNEKRTITEQEDLSLDINQLNNSHVAYTKDIFEALCLRYEEPNGNNRWDAPLFTVFPEDEMPLDEIYNSLYEKAPPKPNHSTQNPPLSDTNYLYELDKITQDIVNHIISARKIGSMGTIKIPNSCDTTINVPLNINSMQLHRMRRAFINYSKSQTMTTSLDKVPNLFIQFLNSNF